MAIFKCKMCGGTIEFNQGDTVGICDSCGTKQTLPKTDDEKRMQLFDRANYFRRENEFDKAMGIYEMILADEKEDAEAYWGIVLCKYGIEYVEDPRTHKRIPTVNRAQYTSVYDDEDYKRALQYADGYQRDIYEAEAAQIDAIQKGILEISGKEEPFDVFICYKETDAAGNRTQDSVIAQDIYKALTGEGYKVFFSRITLETKLGQQYEPYIFAALHSAKVMLVVGTKKENFEAVWVKNEWSRFLSIMKNDSTKVLIPCYKGMSPYEMPEEFTYLQAQDMGKIGFMQDLLHGISKVVTKGAPKETVVINSAGAEVEPLLKRAFIFLEDGDWKKADEFAEQVLNREPENAEAYLVKLLASLRLSAREQLGTYLSGYENNPHYVKVRRYADSALNAELDTYLATIQSTKRENSYQHAVALFEKAINESGYRDAKAAFEPLGDYKDAASYILQCDAKAEACRVSALESAYVTARAKAADGDRTEIISHYEEAIKAFESIKDYKDSAAQIQRCEGEIAAIKEKQERAAAERREKRAQELKKRRKKLAIRFSVFVLVVGILVGAGWYGFPKLVYRNAMDLIEKGSYDDAYALLDFFNQNDAILQNKYDRAVALMKEDKPGEAYELFMENPDYLDSREQAAICMQPFMKKAASHRHKTVAAGLGVIYGIKQNGKVVAAGHLYNVDNAERISSWNQVVSIDAATYCVVAVKKDGTVVATGDNTYGQCNVSKWENVIFADCSTTHTVGLTKGGKVLFKGDDSDNLSVVREWTDIVAIATSESHVVGLRKDGTVWAVGDNSDGQCNTDDWTGIVAVSACNGDTTVGLRYDGTVVAVGDDYVGKLDVDEWKDIVDILSLDNETIGLQKDGTIISTLNNTYTDGWESIACINGSDNAAIAVKKDGTMEFSEMHFYASDLKEELAKFRHLKTK